MISIEAFRKMALALPTATEQPHFEKLSFRIGGKIFATVDVDKQIASLKLSMADQDIFSAYDKSIIYPVPNKWGQQGWTMVVLKKMPKRMLKDALTAAFLQVAPKKIASLLTL